MIFLQKKELTLNIPLKKATNIPFYSILYLLFPFIEKLGSSPKRVVDFRSDWALCC